MPNIDIVSCSECNKPLRKTETCTCGLKITEQASKWIADSGAQAEEMANEGYDGWGDTILVAVEIMVGLMAEISDLTISCQLSEEQVAALNESNIALKLQLSGRTYCHSEGFEKWWNSDDAQFECNDGEHICKLSHQATYQAGRRDGITACLDALKNPSYCHSDEVVKKKCQELESENTMYKAWIKCCQDDGIDWRAAIRVEALEEAARICDIQAEEWDSDRQITDKNYAAHCSTLIRKAAQGVTNADVLNRLIKEHAGEAPAIDKTGRCGRAA